LQIAAEAGLPIPKTVICSTAEDLKDWDTWPAIFKLATGSHGHGVLLARSKSQLVSYIDIAKAMDPKRTFLVQEFVAAHGVQDLRVVIVGGRVIAAMLRSAKEGEFRTNTSSGAGDGSKFELTAEIVEISEKCADRMGASIAGVDLLFSSTGARLCEVNSAPGFSSTDEACGVDVADKIAEYIENLCLAT
jgi:gamma-F420-2:alpha-L-glutamate ligase